MHLNSVTYGIDTATGRAYVNTCRGRLLFADVDSAADFLRARAFARLAADSMVWGVVRA